MPSNSTISNNIKLPNPSFAFLRLYIGDAKFEINNPNHIQQFTYIRKPMNAANKFIISLFDETAIAVENQLIEGYEDIRFQYGIVGGVQSPIYEGKVTEYDVDFNNFHAVLNIEGLSSSISSFNSPKSAKYEGMPIHEIVKQIAKEENWEIGNIVPTQPVADGANPHKEFVREKEIAQSFIKNKLIPLAKSADTGDSDYILNFDDIPGGTRVNFYPAIKASDSGEGATRSYEFTWGSGDKDSKVIDFNPDYSGTLRLVGGGGTIEGESIDNIANEMFSVKYDNKTDSNRTVLGDYSTYDFSKAKTVVGGSSYSYDELNNISANLWYKNANYPVTADMTILGDPDISAFDMISIVVLNKDGIPHHSSGVYLVKEVSDDIAGGTYTTKLTLFRNGMKIGIDENGGISIELSAVYSLTDSGDDSDGSSINTAGGGGNSKLVDIALAEKGNPGGKKFWSWWGYSYPVAWCAIFVSWCAEQAGILGKEVPKFQGCTDGVSQFKGMNRWKDSSHVPKSGDVIFFDVPESSQHVGIVVRADETTVYTVEGNYSDAVCEASYNRASPSRAIAGYGITG